MVRMAQDRDVRRASGLPLAERVLSEGLPYSTTAAFNGTAAVNATWSSNFALPGITRAFWCESLVLTSNKNLVVQSKLGGEALGSGFPVTHEVVVGPGGPVTVPIRTLLRPSQYGSNASLGVGVIRSMIDTDGTNALIRLSAVGYSITDDLDFGAEKVLLHIGDSITAGGTGPTAKPNQYDWRFLNALKALGRSVRMINVSMSGTTSANAERRRSYGDYDFPQVDHVNYSMGVNDAGSSVTAATYKANVAAAIAWKKVRYPKATMTVFGVTPLENSTSEGFAAQYRTAAAEAVTEAADPLVKFCNLGAAFDRTVSSNYASSDPAGSRVHPSDAGHAAIWGVVGPFLAANPVLA